MKNSISGNQALHSQERSIHVTPLSDITSTILNEGNQNTSQSRKCFNSISGVYTQPSPKQPFQRKRRAIDIDSLSVNLMSKFSDRNEKCASSSSSQNLFKENRAHICREDSDVETQNLHNSVEDGETNSDLDSHHYEGTLSKK